MELGRLATYYLFKTEGSHSQLIGMNTEEVLRSNLDVLYNGISDHEKRVMNYLQER